MSMKLLRVVTILAALAVPGLASAQDYPRQTVKLLVGFLAGGPIDTTARIMAESLSQIWGVPVIVENRPGANSRIAIEQLRGAQPDGYTLLVGTNGAMTVNPPLQGLTFDQALRGITPVAFTVDYAYQVVTSVEKPYKTIADLVKAAKEKPGTLTYSSPGIGAVNHVAVEDFAMRAGISVINVPYNGGFAYGSGGRAHRLLLQLGGPAAGAPGQASRAGGDRPAADEGISRRSDDDRSRLPRLRRDAVVCGVRTRESASAADRQD